MCFVLLGYPEVTQRPVLLYTFALLVNVAALGTVWIEPRVRAAQAIVGLPHLHPPHQVDLP